MLIACQEQGGKTPAGYVDPFIGTDFHGHTFPGATVPSGLVQLSPDTGTEGWDWCSGYHSSDGTILGFSHTHLSGTGASDLGDILFMPTRTPAFVPGSKDNTDNGYRSRFSHKFEKAEPGYYSVYLDDVRALVELSATAHSGVQKYGFETNEDHYVTIDLSHGIYDIPTECFIKKVSEFELEGYRRSSGWADDHTLYFYVKFSGPFISMSSMVDDSISLESADSVKADRVVSVLQFSKDLYDLQINVGISYVDIAGARNNLESEVGNADFETIRKKAYEDWEKALSVVKVEGDNVRKKIFYTALYHSMIAPYIMSDVDGRYRSSNRNIYKSNEPNYGLFSTWDTFRALHPLMTIVAPEKNNQFVNSLIRYYEESGRLPVWDLNMRENFCMIGYHSIPIITDAFFKGARIDSEKALEAMINSSTEDSYLGLGDYRYYHYMPFDLQQNSVSKALEFAYDDWCIAKFAKALGKDEIYNEYIKRAQYYKPHFDSIDTFIKGRDSHGCFRKDFSPTQISILGVNDFTEGNSWHYSFFAPQDVNTLISLMGGDEKFIEKLDELFNSVTVTDGAAPDVSGLIGNYAHGNEPSHHSAYLYAFAGQQWKTAEKVAQICSQLYSSERDGLCGNEDCGQMSAWYVMSSMGFYEVTPGSCDYILGSPQFDTVIINNANGNRFQIIADNLSDDNIYIGGATFNGNEYSKGYITHDMILSGGTLVLKMQDEPDKQFAQIIEDRPHSVISDNVFTSEELLSEITFDPYIDVEERFFKDSIVITPKSENDAEIYYTLDGTIPTVRDNIVKAPITLKEDCVLSLVAKDRTSGVLSRCTTARFYKGRIEQGAKITFPAPAEQYSGEGSITLTDGLIGGSTHASGRWLGWNGGNFEISVELPTPRKISYVGVDFYASVDTWIALPKNFIVEFESDANGKIISREVIIPDGTDRQKGSYLFGTDCDVIVKNLRIIIPENTIPAWHRFRDNKAWIFIDEILVK